MIAFVPERVNDQMREYLLSRARGGGEGGLDNRINQWRCCRVVYSSNITTLVPHVKARKILLFLGCLRLLQIPR